MKVWFPVLDCVAIYHEYYVKKGVLVRLRAGHNERSARFNVLYLTNPTTLCFSLWTSPSRATEVGFLTRATRLRKGCNMLPFFPTDTCSVTVTQLLAAKPSQWCHLYIRLIIKIRQWSFFTSHIKSVLTPIVYFSTTVITMTLRDKVLYNFKNENLLNLLFWQLL
jgi:hypothetical protein